MKKVLSFFFLAILLALMDYPLCLANKINGPNILIEEREFDAKLVNENDVIEHTFKVLNTGDGPLEIKRVKPG